MKYFLIVIYICSALILPCHAQNEDRELAMRREAETLQAMAIKPGQKCLLQLSGFVSFKEHLELFDRAFDACRRALRSNPDDTSVRANLGALYLWRDSFHPDESGNFEKAIDQFLITLSKDPNSESALTYLGAHEVLTRVHSELSDKGLDRIESALREALKTSENAAILRAFISVASANGHGAEAQEAAQKLAKHSSDFASYLLIGISELKRGFTEKAISAFQTAQSLSSNNVEKATALLGMAQASVTGSNPDKSKVLLDKAKKLVASPVLDQAAKAANLYSPAEIYRAIGNAYVASGKIDRAIIYLGTETVDHITAVALAKIKSGKGNEAIAPLLSAIELDPNQAELLTSIARLSFNADRYAITIWAYERAKKTGEKLDERDLTKIGISCMVLGDYKKAYEAFDKAYKLASDNQGIRQWRMAAAFGVGGWDMAYEAVDRDTANNDGSNPFRDTFYNVYWIFHDTDNRAKRAKLLRPRLYHLSALYELMSKSTVLSFEGREEKWETLWEIIDLYNELPLKPIPPQRAVEQAAIAENIILRGDLSANHYKAKRAAIAATAIAPWWPEARYNLGVFARDSFYSENFEEIYYHSEKRESWNNIQSATMEFFLYLKLAPQGQKAAEVRKQFKKWNIEWPPK